jgi:two-component system OmpR family response regulator
MSRSILVVDDDEVLGDVLSRVLADGRQTIWRAGTAAQALGLARVYRPRLALLDLCLPDGDGIELGRRLRDELPDVALILMTAYPLRLRERPELGAAFDRVLTKPLDLNELREAVDASLALCP